MIVFDASGSMVADGEASVRRIDEARRALARVLPQVTRYRRIGLITYGPGPFEQCNVQLNFQPVPNAAERILRAVGSLEPAGRTPLTTAVEDAANVLDFRHRPGAVVLVTDGEETCSRSPCDLAKKLHALAKALTIHVIAYRLEIGWDGQQGRLETKCLSDYNNGLYVPVSTEEELVASLQKTLGCPFLKTERVVHHVSELGRRKAMSSSPRRGDSTALRIVRLAVIGSAVLFSCTLASRAEEKTIPLCQEDAMIVFDASGSMLGYETIGETIATPNLRPRIEEARSALARILPSATRFRRVGLVTYGPGPWNQCNVNLNLRPMANAASLILKTVNSINPAGKTPLTQGIEAAAEALDFRRNPGVVVVITDGEETCGRSPCELGKRLRAAGFKLTVHVIAFRYEGYTLSERGVSDLMCMARQNRGLYIPANTENELVEALEKTLDCPMVSQAPLP